MTTLKTSLVTAVRDWAVDQGMTPHVIVDADKDQVRVPQAYIRDGQIVLNVHPRAIENYGIAEEVLFFSARFGAQSENIEIPMPAILAIYAKENGEGISFPHDQQAPTDPSPSDDPDKPIKARPQLKIVK